jgi:hypothetical protein
MRVKSAANGRPTNKSKVKQHTGTNEGLLKENRDAEINISNVFLVNCVDSLIISRDKLIGDVDIPRLFLRLSQFGPTTME